MALWMQHLIVLLLVGGCVAFVAVNGYRAMLGKRSKLGSCCAKGCGDSAPKTDNAPKTERVVFFPSEMLTSSHRRK